MSSDNREIHLRDPQPFADGPPPNITLLEGDNNTVTRVALRYSNTAGLKVVGSSNFLSELLILVSRLWYAASHLLPHSKVRWQLPLRSWACCKH